MDIISGGRGHVQANSQYLQIYYAGEDLNRARNFAGKNVHKNLDLKHIYFFKTGLQIYAPNIYRHLFEKFRYPIRRRGCFHASSVIHLVRLGTAI